MRNLRTLPMAVAFISILGLAVSQASAATVYELVPGSGELTAVYLDGDAFTNVLAIPSGQTGVAITGASITVDFAALDLDNLFVEVAGPATINLPGGPTVIFTDASLTGAGSLSPPSVGEYPYSLDFASLTATVDGSPFSASSFGAAGTILTTGPDGLDITLNNVSLGFLEVDGVFRQVNANFHFVARNVSGATAIPEPGSQLLFPAGLALLGWALRFRKAEAR